MPLYEYQCDACGHRFEMIQKFSDPPASSCPRCGQSVRKLVSSPAFQFKGSGWYVTDYARKADGAKAETKAEEAGTKGTAGDAKEPAKKDGDKAQVTSDKAQATSDKAQVTSDK